MYVPGDELDFEEGNAVRFRHPREVEGLSLPSWALAKGGAEFFAVVDADSLSLNAASAFDLVKTFPSATGTMCFSTNRVRSTGSSRFCLRSGLSNICSRVLGSKMKNIPLHFFPNITLMSFHVGPIQVYCNFYYLGRRNLSKRSFLTNKELVVINVCLNLAKMHVVELLGTPFLAEYVDAFGYSTDAQLTNLIIDFRNTLMNGPTIETAPRNSTMRQTEFGAGEAQLLLFAFDLALHALHEENGEVEDRSLPDLDLAVIPFESAAYTGTNLISTLPELSRTAITGIASELFQHHTFTGNSAGFKKTFARMNPDIKIKKRFRLEGADVSEADDDVVADDDEEDENPAVEPSVLSAKKLYADIGRRSQVVIGMFKNLLSLHPDVTAVLDVGVEFRPVKKGQLFLVDTQATRTELRRSNGVNGVILNSRTFADMMDEADVEEFITNQSEDDELDFPGNEPGNQSTGDDLDSLPSMLAAMADMHASTYESLALKGAYSNIHPGPIRCIPSRPMGPGTGWIFLEPARSMFSFLGMQAYVPMLKAVCGAFSPLHHKALLSKLPSLVQTVLSPMAFDIATREKAFADCKECLRRLVILRNEYDVRMKVFTDCGCRFETFVLLKSGTGVADEEDDSLVGAHPDEIVGRADHQPTEDDPSGNDEESTAPEEITDEEQTLPEFRYLKCFRGIPQAKLRQQHEKILDLWFSPLEKVFLTERVFDSTGLSPACKTALFAFASLLVKFFDAAPYDGPLVKELRKRIPDGYMFHIPRDCRKQLTQTEKDLTNLEYGVDPLLMPVGRFAAITTVRVPVGDTLGRDVNFNYIISTLTKKVRLPREFASAHLQVKHWFLKYCDLGERICLFETEGEVGEPRPTIDDDAASDFGYFEEPVFERLHYLNEIERTEFLSEISGVFARLYQQEWYNIKVTRNKDYEDPSMELHDFPGNEGEFYHLNVTHADSTPHIQLARTKTDATRQQKLGIVTAGMFVILISVVSDFAMIAIQVLTESDSVIMSFVLRPDFTKMK